MRAILLVVFAIAIAAAGGAAYLVNDFLQEQRRQAAAPVPALPVFTGQRVMVADGVIPAGTAIRPSMVRWQPWPAEDILAPYKVIGDGEGLTERQIFTQRNQFEENMTGLITRRTVAAGEPITDALVFERVNANFMAGNLSPGMRAIALPVNATTGVAGFILPGDYVDVVLTHDLRDSLPRGVDAPGANSRVSRYVSETILESLRVLAVDRLFRDNDESEPQVVKNVTVEATPSEVEILNLARQMGSITLTLRALSDRQEPVGLAALLGFGDVTGGADREMVSDRRVSPALDFLMQAAYEQAMREREDEIARDRERLLAELDLDGSGMSEPEPVMAAPAPAPAPAPEPAAWEVRVYHGSAQPVVHSGEQGMAAAQTVGGEPDSSLPDPAANGDPLPLTPEMEQEIPIEE
jgi:pilus assembly protein CpaB